MSNAGTSSQPPALSYYPPLPDVTAIPVLVDSPHSGQHIPHDWPLACCPTLLRQRTEDCHVDLLCADTPRLGAHFLKANTARAYIDVNRPLSSLGEDDIKPPYRLLKPTHDDVNARNGRGLYWRTCLQNGRHVPIIMNEDRPDEVDLLARIHRIWVPYHGQISAVTRHIRESHGLSIHFNLHAFYPTGKPLQSEVVIGDLYGSSCASSLTDYTVHHFARRGYRTAINRPYPGGEILRRMGAPESGQHVLQIEIRKDLYMDPETLALHNGYDKLRGAINSLVVSVGSLAQLPRQQRDANQFSVP